MKLLRSKIMALAALVLLAACGQVGTPGSSNPQPVSDVGTAVGLTATYKSLEASPSGCFQIVQRDTSLAFDWGRLTPVGCMAAGAFEANWAGQLVAPESGSYRFELETNGSVSLTLGGNAVTSGAAMDLEKGRAYPLSLTYRKTSSEAALVVRWRLEGKDKEFKVISPSALRTDAPKTVGRQSVSAQAVNYGVNLLRNPGFEEGTGMWVRYSGTRTLVQPGRSGTGNAVQIGNFGWVQQDIAASNLEVGTVYSLRGWMRSSSEEQVCAAIVSIGTASGRVVQGGFSHNLTSYTYEQGEVFAPIDAQWIAVHLSSQDNTCRFDDLELVAADPNIGDPPPAATVSSPIVNPDFIYGLRGWQRFGGVADSRSELRTLITAPYTWVQQNIPTNLLNLGSYRLKVGIGADDNTTCTAGIGSDQISLNQQVSVTKNDPGLKTISFTLTSRLSYFAIYLASQGTGLCRFNSIRLELSELVGTWVDTGLTPLSTTQTAAFRSKLFTTDRNGNLAGVDYSRVWRIENGVVRVYPDIFAWRFSAIITNLDLSFDRANNPQLIYRIEDYTDYSRSEVVAVRWNGSAWSRIASRPFTPTFPASAAWSSQDQPVVLDISETQLRVFEWNGSAWAENYRLTPPSGSTFVNGTSSIYKLVRAANGDLFINFQWYDNTTFTSKQTVVQRRGQTWSEVAGLENGFEFADAQSALVYRGGDGYYRQGGGLIAPRFEETVELNGFAGEQLLARLRRSEGPVPYLHTARGWQMLPYFSQTLNAGTPTESAYTQYLILGRPDGSIHALAYYFRVCEEDRVYGCVTTRLYRLAVQ